MKIKDIYTTSIDYDPKDEKSVIPLITKESYTRLKNEGVVSEGMLPKLDNAFFALERGVSEVYIKKWSNLSPEGGTMLRF